MPHSCRAYSSAVALKVLHLRLHLPTHTPAKPHGAHGFFLAATGRAGHSGDRYRHLCARMGDSTLDHRARHFLADGAVAQHQWRINTQ